MFKHPHGNGSFRSTSWSQLCDSDLFFTVQKPGAGGCARALEGVQRLCPVLESCGSAAAQCAQHFRAESPLPLFIFAEAVCKTLTAGKEPIIPNTLQKQENGMLAGAGVLEPPASAAPRALRCYLVRFCKCCLDTLACTLFAIPAFSKCVLPAELMLKKSIYCIHLLILLQWKMLILEPLMSYTENLYWAVVIHSKHRHSPWVQTLRCWFLLPGRMMLRSPERGTTSALSKWHCPCVRAISAEVTPHTGLPGWHRNTRTLQHEAERILLSCWNSLPSSCLQVQEWHENGLWLSQKWITLTWVMAGSQVWGWGPEKQQRCNVLAFHNSLWASTAPVPPACLFSLCTNTVARSTML